MIRRRLLGPALGAVVLASSWIVLPFGSSAAVTAHAAPVVGHLAFVTNSNRLEVVTVRANGATSAPHRIAPTLAATKAGAATLGQVFASPDGHWLAWTEYRPDDDRPLLVLRRQSSGQETRLRTSELPVGFAGDTLIVTFNTTKRLVLSPHPHFVRIKNARNALNGYPGGVVSQSFSDNEQVAHVWLTTFAGHRTLLHTYDDAGAPDYRTPDAAWVSNGGEHLVIERGNHQDFDGLGPSSLADEFSLHGRHHRQALGTYSSAPTGSSWRLSTATYVGTNGHVWAAWERSTGTSAVTLVASYSRGRWHRQASGAITVAGNHGGWVVIQPGDYRESNPEGFPVAHATAHALLRHGSSQHRLGVEGTQFFWVFGR